MEKGSVTAIDTWNQLKKEVIMAKNVQQLKEKVDKYRYEDWTTLGKYTHTYQQDECQRT